MPKFAERAGSLSTFPVSRARGIGKKVTPSPERHDNDFTHCFLVTFDSEDGRATYLQRPEHQTLVKLLEPVLDEAWVLDFWAEK